MIKNIIMMVIVLMYNIIYFSQTKIMFGLKLRNINLH